MATDEGSAEMKRLLEEESQRLTDDAHQLVAALREAPSLPYGIPPQAGFDALGDARQFFRELRAQIELVETTDSAKAEILDALDTLDRGYGRYEGALETGISRKAKLRAKSAKQVLRRGARDLQAAKERLG